MRFKCIFFFLFLCNILYAQVKDERERRISKNDMPILALEFLERLPNNCKRFKYYKETDGPATSYEAKFKYNQKIFSVEFSNEGLLEDIEVIVKLKKITPNAKNKIQYYFKTQYKKHQIIKLQKQYKNVTDTHLNKLLDNALYNKQHTPVFYEIVAEVFSGKKRSIVEFIFDSSGKLLNQRPLKPSSYEHILY